MIVQKSFRSFSKYFNKEFLQRQISQNPEFDRAFPQLAKLKPETTTHLKYKEFDFIESLSYENRIPQKKDIETSLLQNQQRFVEGYLSPQGPFSQMTQVEKNKIHLLVEKKLQELEDTGLSRQELLHDKPEKGVPLSQDPFFQFLKQNRMVREMLIKEGEEFTVQKMIDLVLKQDIGVDPSVARYPIKNYTIQDGQSSQQKRMNQIYALKTRPTDEQLQQELTNNLVFHRMPVKASVKRKRNQRYLIKIRRVNYYDIHWRNCELLTDFLTPSGRIQGRFQSRLPGNIQHKMSKTIKHARSMLLFPMGGYLKASDKRSLRSLQEDIDDFTRTSINLETGQIIYKQEQNISYDYTKSSRYEDYIQLFQDINEIDTDSVNIQSMSLVEGQLYAQYLKEKELILMGVDIKELHEKQERNEMEHSPLLAIMVGEVRDKMASINKEAFKPSFNHHIQNLEKTHVVEFSDIFLAEKAQDYKEMQLLSTRQENSSKTIQELALELNQLKQQLQLELETGLEQQIAEKYI